MLYFLRPNVILKKEMDEAKLRTVQEEALQLVHRISEEKFPPVKSSRCDTCAYGSTYCKILEGAGGSPGNTV
jgi:CRISPR/Cas system-associated exonuclease Cas4 (RecB family)